MSVPQSKQILLKSLRARLALDAGLGVDFTRLPRSFWDAVARTGDVGDAGEPERRSRASPSRAEIAGSSFPDFRSEPLFRPSSPSTSFSSPPAFSSPSAFSSAAGCSTGARFQAVACSLVPYVEPPACPEKEALLAPLRAEAERCTACELCQRRTHVAWGEGNLNARVMFIGEGPGRDEDREGRPFVGRSGRLLTDIIEKGMRTPRCQVYIANIVKCRPPGNREPKPEEAAACSRYLEKQLEVVKPEILVAVGGVAGCALLGLPPRTPGLRGKWHEFRGLPLRVIFHPSYLLRQRRTDADRTDADRATWKDVQEVMTRLG